MELESKQDGTDAKPGIPPESERYGLDFHKWPLGIAVAVTLALYGLIWFFVDPTPPYIDPTQLPPPPGSF